jgi:hypothetical protein
MPLFRALAKNMAASYFGESALRFCNGSYTSVCLYSVARGSYSGMQYAMTSSISTASQSVLVEMGSSKFFLGLPLFYI